MSIDRPATEPSVLRIPSGRADRQIALHHLAPIRSGPGSGRPPVLFVHGATFPTALAAGYRFDGVSWMDDLAAHGFDLWGLDFLGFGRSDRYAEMAEPAERHAPLGRAGVASQQIAAAVDHIRASRGVAQVSIIAHSWGTLAAGHYAGGHAAELDRLVLFGPVATRHELPPVAPGAAPATPAWYLVTEAAQRDRFNGYVPAGQPLAMLRRHVALWGPDYIATDPTAATRSPPSVRVPAGPIADIDDAWTGRLAYDPSKITAPALIVRGAWETVTRDADAAWLFDALTGSPLRRDIKLAAGTHVMHLERTRHELYRVVRDFLAAAE